MRDIESRLKIMRLIRSELVKPMTDTCNKIPEVVLKKGMKSIKDLDYKKKDK